MDTLTYMNRLSPWEPGIVSLYHLRSPGTFGLVEFLLLIAGWLGEKKPGLRRRILTNAESSRPERPRSDPVSFYLIAVFLIFDEWRFTFIPGHCDQRLGGIGGNCLLHDCPVSPHLLFLKKERSGSGTNPRNPVT